MASDPPRLLSPAQEEQLQGIVKNFQEFAAVGLRRLEEEGPKMRRLLDSWLTPPRS